MQQPVIEKHKPTSSQSRLINHIKGKEPGPTVVFFAGIHGNEQAGVKALKRVLKNVEGNVSRGNIYGIYGNLKALKTNKRFIDEDLNRMWTHKKLEQLKHNDQDIHEKQEQRELYTILSSLIEKTKGPMYFIDLHTTSSVTLPFITINDAIINRKFAKHFPCPVVLGIEEYLEGPLLSYLNTRGYVSLGFESGQHIDPQAIINGEAFIYLTLVQLQLLKDVNPERYDECRNTLNSAS
ncbi:MAG: succinylglutamate desuccinylase/aspartoacylase family protein, partial [Bacteroidota bacterium]